MSNEFSFTCTGHEHISSLHDKTVEFTKDNFVTPTGDCILGINADFDYSELKKWMNQFKDCEVLKCLIECNETTDEFEFCLDKKFCSEEEIVFRRSDFKSDRTLGTRCTKCACDINREIVDNMKKQKLEVKLKISFSK